MGSDPHPPIELVLSTGREVRKAFEKLTRNGMDRRLLANVLCEIPKLPTNRVLIAGKTNAGAKKFHVRLERLAEEIEKVNKKTSLIRELILKWTEGPIRITSFREELWGLPDSLRSYAYWLRTAIKETSSIRDNPQKSGVLWLIVKIKASTSHFYFADVALLLDAAFHAFGASKPRKYDEEGLRKLYKNNPRLVAKLSPPHSTTRTAQFT